MPAGDSRRDTPSWTRGTAWLRDQELSPWDHDGETWRRLAVTFPDSVPIHSRKQAYYIDGDDRVVLGQLEPSVEQ